MKTGFTFSLGWAAKTCGLPSGHTVGIPASATVSLLALSTAVPRSRTSANTESFISLTLATASPGLYASSLTTTRSLRPSELRHVPVDEVDLRAPSALEVLEHRRLHVPV